MAYVDGKERIAFDVFQGYPEPLYKSTMWFNSNYPNATLASFDAGIILIDAVKQGAKAQDFALLKQSAEQLANAAAVCTRRHREMHIPFVPVPRDEDLLPGERRMGMDVVERQVFDNVPLFTIYDLLAAISRTPVASALPPRDTNPKEVLTPANLERIEAFIKHAGIWVQLVRDSFTIASEVLRAEKERYKISYQQGVLTRRGYGNYTEEEFEQLPEPARFMLSADRPMSEIMQGIRDEVKAFIKAQPIYEGTGFNVDEYVKIFRWE